MDKDTNKSYNIQLIFFWINIIIISGLTFSLYIGKGPDFNGLTSSNVLFERYAILLTLAVIPLSLKLFHNHYQKIASLETIAFRQKYLLASYIRIIVFDAVIALNLVGFHLYNSLNTLYLTIMIIFALFFCYPNKKALQNEQASEESENIN